MNQNVLFSTIAFLACVTGSEGLATAPDLAQVRQRVAALPVPFVPNAGQWDPQAAFAARTFAGTLFVTTEGKLVYSLAGRPIAGPGDDAAAGALPRRPHMHQQAGARTPGWVLTETLVDAAGLTLSAAPHAGQPLKGKVSYAIGNDASRHRDGLPSYERVSLGEVYPGVDVQVRATGSNVEKIFTVAPGHDPQVIRIEFGGTEKLELGAAGELIAHTGNGPVAYTSPVAYQEDAAGQRTDVAVRYVLDALKYRYGFAVGTYDNERPLVIDPLLQSTYLGGNGDDVANALAIHPATGEVYVAGNTLSTDFPKVAGAEQTTRAGDFHDAFVTRFDAALTTRLQSTYLGGNSDDYAAALAIHPATGEVYVAGNTTSTDFPKIAGAEQTVKGSGNDAFVTRLNAALTIRLQSTYLGGNSEDYAAALAIHPATGEVYVAGNTDSTDFPKVAGAEQTVKGTGEDAFVTRLNAALTTRLQSTYLGGDVADLATALAIHPATGEVYVAGYTNSTDFPKVAGAEQTVKAFGWDAIVTRLNATLTTRLQSTHLGGNGDDYAAALAIHPATGEVYVAGYTDSTDFPKLAGAEQTVKGSGKDAFVTRLNAALTTRLQSTYLGGNSEDSVAALAIQPATGDVYVAGFTASTDFPKVAGAEQTTHAGGFHDAFVTRFDAALTTRQQSTYLGGNGYDGAFALAIHPTTGDVYAVGVTTSTDFPKVAGAEQTVKGTGSDAFVGRYSFDLMANDVVPNTFSFPPKLNVPPGSLQVSAGAQILGIFGLAPISVGGGGFAQYCVSSSSECGCDVVPFTFTAGTIAVNQFVCVRQQAPLGTPGANIVTVVVGGGVAQFVVTTGRGLMACSLDVDGNSNIDALTDGLMLLRAMFGLTGTSVTNNAIGASATRSTWAQIRRYLNDNCGADFAP